MSIPFFYEPYIDFNSIALSDETMHHATNVLRMREGEQFWLTNGAGKKCLCTIDVLQKRAFQYTINSFSDEPISTPTLHLAISFTKNAARIEWLLEKATEMGVHQITPLLTSRTERNYFKRERLEKILVSAMLQSQQVHLPKLNEATELKTLIAEVAELKFIAHCEANQPRSSFHQALPSDKDVIILIGPEGDFTEDEIHLCLEANCLPVSFGKNRLRTETAGIYACTVFNAKQEF
jgi:16S rRNA (uracil1498-N3)-methyltransferase